MRIKSISHSGLTVSDFRSAVAWYHEHFGFLLVSEDRLGPEETRELFPLYQVEGARVRMGFLMAPRGAVIELFQFEPARQGGAAVWNAPGFTHVALDVSGLRGWVERLSAVGVEFVTEPRRTGKVEWAFLRDPDGNLVELIDLKAARPALKAIGGLLGSTLKKGKYSTYYGKDE